MGNSKCSYDYDEYFLQCTFKSESHLGKSQRCVLCCKRPLYRPRQFELHYYGRQKGEKEGEGQEGKIAFVLELFFLIFLVIEFFSYINVFFMFFKRGSLLVYFV